MSETKFHTHTEPEAKLLFCTFQFLRFYTADEKTKVMDRMMASIARIQSPPE
jgi:hypothetical protein